MTEPFAFTVNLNIHFDDAIERVTKALQAEGFGVLTKIDVKETLKEKLDEDFRPYVILGACNPPLAHRALSNEPEVGIMLPCNVTVEERDSEVIISIVNPEAMMTMGNLGENPRLREVAAEARSKLKRVSESLKTPGG
jgi:uncharacterized protein (DUF302 family)